ncbi:MAG: hypothetical protein GEU88_18815 [Solirubrobacterales bacterium]|nr:hypothetical protein [Solirubrobacterales bacterium]
MAVASARRPGQEEVIRHRPRPPGRCVSPGCEEPPLPDGRFCAAHQEVLDRVRAELGGEAKSGELDRRWRRTTTRGMASERPKQR